MKDISILFSSYGQYSFLLPVTYHFFNKNCKQFDVDIFWGSNGEKITEFSKIAPNWNYITKNKEDLGWSQNLYSYLEELDTKYVLLLLDDFLFLNTPDFKKVEDGFKLMKRLNAVYLRLNSNPIPDKKLNEVFGKINYYSDYRSSLQPTIWEKKTLMKLCTYNFSPWLFEWKAGIVDETIDKIFLGSYENLIKTRHCIEKGMWIKDIYEIIKKEGLDTNSNIKIWENTANDTFNSERKIINLIPKRIQFHLRKILKKGIFSDSFKGSNHK